MKIKIFRAASIRKLEEEINAWLEEQTKAGTKIISLHQSFEGSMYLISILHEPKKPTKAGTVKVGF